MTKPLVEEGKAQVVVVRLGSAGALLVTREATHRLKSPTVPIVSNIGAGNSMAAGIVTSLARGKVLLPATRYGVDAGSAAKMTPAIELCRKEETERLNKQISPETA